VYGYWTSQAQFNPWNVAAGNVPPLWNGGTVCANATLYTPANVAPSTYMVVKQAGSGYPEGSFLADISTAAATWGNKPFYATPAQVHEAWWQYGAGCNGAIYCLTWSPGVLARLAAMTRDDMKMSTFDAAQSGKTHWDGLMFDLEYGKGWTSDSALFTALMEAIAHLQTVCQVKVGITFIWNGGTYGMPWKFLPAACVTEATAHLSMYPSNAAPDGSWCSFTGNAVTDKSYNMTGTHNGKTIWQALDRIAPMVYSEGTANHAVSAGVAMLKSGSAYLPPLAASDYSKVIWSCSLNTTPEQYAAMSTISGSLLYYGVPANCPAT